VTAYKAHLVPPAHLSDDLLRTWRSHQASDEALQGPFFSPEYVTIAALARPEVTVAVVERPGEPPAFLPFHRDRSNLARPVGLRACDFSGVIAPAGTTWSPEPLILSCGLSGWDFANVATTQAPLQPHFQAYVDSPYIDVHGGFDHYAAERKNAGSDLLRSISQKYRKLEREVGPIRVEIDSQDRHAFDRLIEWKSAQRARTGSFDVLPLAWMREMLNRIRATQSPDFAGVLSVAYAGGDVAAVHMGMRTRSVWHYWIAAFNRDLQQYSPGLILLLEMVRAAPLLGIKTITLGRGDEQYKTRFASGTTVLASGSVDCRVTRRLANAIWYAARRVSLSTPAVAAMARSVKRRSQMVFYRREPT